MALPERPLSRRQLLRRLIPSEPPPLRARIITEHCIAHAGPECGACVGHCRGTQAIRLVRWRPVLDQRLCDGCGACLAACPTTPRAIAIEPIRSDGLPSPEP